MTEKKEHENPEFQVIRQSEANAKFFVASSTEVTGNITAMSVERTDAADARNYFF